SATTACCMATAVLTEGARVWPSTAGFWSGLFGGRVSTGAPVAAGACPSSCPLAPQAARTRAAAETAKRAGRMAAPEQRGVEEAGCSHIALYASRKAPRPMVPHEIPVEAA